MRATKRADIAEIADKNRDLLTADEEVEKNPEKYFDKIIELNLSQLEPYVVGPHTPDLARPISQLAREVKEKNYPEKITSALIGSCTNSSYEDLSRVADIAAQAKAAKVKSAVQLMVSPGSDQIYETVKRDGQAQALEDIGATVLANACGPCIGQWKRDDIKSGEKNSILTSFNRNFPKRNDGNSETLAFIASPEIVVAMALAGRLSFNPLSDSLRTAEGKTVKLSAPKQADDLPKKGFVAPLTGLIVPVLDGSSIEIDVDPKSERLQLLKPFSKWDGKDFIEIPILLKVKGKCTTDHISPAGPWLKYRGHLDKISDNMLIGAISAFSGQASQEVPKIARTYKARGLRWAVVGDENYGEGSSREHAAMSPRYLGCAAVITRSFARIHETNLKKQGILPLTFSNPADYNSIQEGDKISLLSLKDLANGKNVTTVLLHANGEMEKIFLQHTLTAEQIDWFKAGSALNLIRGL